MSRNGQPDAWSGYTGVMRPSPLLIMLSDEEDAPGVLGWETSAQERESKVQKRGKQNCCYCDAEWAASTGTASESVGRYQPEHGRGILGMGCRWKKQNISINKVHVTLVTSLIVVFVQIALRGNGSGGWGMVNRTDSARCA